MTNEQTETYCRFNMKLQDMILDAYREGILEYEEWQELLGSILGVYGKRQPLMPHNGVKDDSTKR